MSFLKRLAVIIAQVGATAVGIGPLVLPLFGNKAGKASEVFNTVTNDLTSIGALVLQTEVALAGKPGPEKFAAALNLIGPYLRTSQLVSGKKIADEALFQKGAQEVTQGLVDILNSLHADSVKTEVA